MGPRQRETVASAFTELAGRQTVGGLWAGLPVSSGINLGAMSGADVFGE
jgi:hypothetical protein